MSLSSEIEELFTQAQRNIDSVASPFGLMQREDGPDMRMVTVNENFAAVQKALLLIAAKIDAGAQP